MSRLNPDIAVPALRLLLACMTMIAAPCFLGMQQWPVVWLAVPCAVLTWLSCSLQGYREPRLVALCALSIAPVLAGLYAAAYFGARLLAGDLIPA